VYFFVTLAQCFTSFSSLFLLDRNLPLVPFETLFAPVFLPPFLLIQCVVSALFFFRERTSYLRVDLFVLPDFLQVTRDPFRTGSLYENFLFCQFGSLSPTSRFFFPFCADFSVSRAPVFPQVFPHNPYVYNPPPIGQTWNDLSLHSKGSHFF